MSFRAQYNIIKQPVYLSYGFVYSISTHLMQYNGSLSIIRSVMRHQHLLYWTPHLAERRISLYATPCRKAYITGRQTKQNGVISCNYPCNKLFYFTKSLNRSHGCCGAISTQSLHQPRILLCIAGPVRLKWGIRLHYRASFYSGDPVFSCSQEYLYDVVSSVVANPAGFTLFHR